MTEKPQPPGELTGTLSNLGGAFDNVGKVTAGIAGLGGLAYLVALAVMAIRLHDAGLPSLEVLSALPRDQLLVSGIVELTVTLGVAVLLAALIVFGARMRPGHKQGQPQADGTQPAEAKRLGRRRLRRLRWRSEHSAARGLLILLVALSVAFAPLSTPGLVWVAAQVGLLVFVLLRRPPVLQVLLVAALAACALTLTRQLEFPSPYPGATVAVTVEEGGESRLETLTGRYVGATSDEVLIGVKDADTEELERLLGTRLPSSLLQVPRSQVDQIVLKSVRAPSEPSDSLAERILGISLTCLIPTCRAGNRSVETPL
jgi:hypothetical protein